MSIRDKERGCIRRSTSRGATERREFRAARRAYSRRIHACNPPALLIARKYIEARNERTSGSSRAHPRAPRFERTFSRAGTVSFAPGELSFRLYPFIPLAVRTIFSLVLFSALLDLFRIVTSRFPSRRSLRVFFSLRSSLSFLRSFHHSNGCSIVRDSRSPTRAAFMQSLYSTLVRASDSLPVGRLYRDF